MKSGNGFGGTLWYYYLLWNHSWDNVYGKNINWKKFETTFSLSYYVSEVTLMHCLFWKSTSIDSQSELNMCSSFTRLYNVTKWMLKACSFCFAETNILYYIWTDRQFINRFSWSQIWQQYLIVLKNTSIGYSINNSVGITFVY